MDLFFLTLLNVLSPLTLLLLLSGVIIGIIIGSIPGLTAVMGVALLLPITFGLDPVNGLVLLIGVYVGGISGGLVAATLLGIPGTPSSIATTLDAYPMSKNGEPVRALGIGIVASLIGGLISFVILVTVSPLIARLAIKMGPPEYLSLIILAMTLIIGLSRENMVKGLTSGMIGLTVAMIGFAPIDGTARYTFDVVALTAGISLLPLILGLFAISQIHLEVQGGPIKQKINLKVKGFGVSIKELVSNTRNLLRSSFIGIIVGMLPGMGSGASNLIAYSQAKQASKKSKDFGKGSPEGIYASESANNAAVGGALVPMMTLGIPGDSVTAILLGGLIIHGIQPGPLLFTNNADIVNVIYIAFLIATILIFLLMFFGMRIFPRILMIPQKYLFPILLVMTVIGAYAANHRNFDLWVMLLFGVIGFIMMKNEYPLAPMVLAFVLAPLFETYLRRSIINADQPLDIIMRPVPAIITAFSIFIVIWMLIKEIKDIKRQNTT